MIEIIAIGKAHDALFRDAITSYEQRLQKPFIAKWHFIPHASTDAARAVQEESERIIKKLPAKSTVILLDERGVQYDSPSLAQQLDKYTMLGQPIIFVIGGAYGVSEALRQRATIVWSLSKLVFPHQLVRLLLTEQLYRAQTILQGKPYHHS